MGDEISDAKLQKKLKREYRSLSELKQFIFWTHVGETGALHFKELIRQKEMAEHLQESVACGLSVGKAQKMIKRSGAHIVGILASAHYDCHLTNHALPHIARSMSRRKVTKSGSKRERISARVRSSPPPRVVAVVEAGVVLVAAVDAGAVADAGAVRAQLTNLHDAQSGFLLCPINKGEHIRTHVQ